MAELPNEISLVLDVIFLPDLQETKITEIINIAFIFIY
jgi:hypothetical protein